MNYLQGALEADEFHYGVTKVADTLIYLNTKQSAGQLRESMLHELLHAILSYAPQPLTYDDEERLCRSLSPWLLMTLRDNPDLVKFLLTDS